MAKKRGKIKNKNLKEYSKKKSHGKMFLIIITIVVFLIIISIFLSKGKNSYPQAQIDAFAKCLTEKGTTMYGAFWCPHCARTKAKFGSSFRYVNYVECDPRGKNEQSVLCIQKNIDKYDTWEFANGERLVAEPTFEAMAEKSGCPLGRN